MNDRRFDERVRAKTQKEVFTPTLEAEGKLAQAMREGTAEWALQPRKKVVSLRRAAASAAAVAAVLMLVFLQPFSDSKLGGERQMTAAQPAFTPIPVTVPEVFINAMQTGACLDTSAAFSNHTGDIWIIQWNLGLKRDDHPQRTLPVKTIWLETGITYTDHEPVWYEEGDWPSPVQVHCRYQAYRVTAKILHWMDGEWLRPGQEGYAEQQSLMEDALAAGAIILYPGDWPEGESGEMTLLLPDSLSQEDPLAYYAENGMLERVLDELVEAPSASTGG